MCHLQIILCPLVTKLQSRHQYWECRLRYMRIEDFVYVWLHTYFTALDKFLILGWKMPQALIFLKYQRLEPMGMILIRILVSCIRCVWIVCCSTKSVEQGTYHLAVRACTCVFVQVCDVCLSTRIRPPRYNTSSPISSDSILAQIVEYIHTSVQCLLG